VNYQAQLFGWFAFIRAVHFGACLLVFGVFAFDRFIVAPIQVRGIDLIRLWLPIARTLMGFALPVVLLSGAAWFAVVAINMSGLAPREALGYDNLSLVWTTQFGRLWKLRGALWIGALAGSIAVAVLRNRQLLRTTFTWLGLTCGGFLAASLAWSGHGQDGDAIAPWHLAADALHILIGGLWPLGLLPLAMLLFELLKGYKPDEMDTADRPGIIYEITCRFSASSLASVGILSVTGLVNSWFLVGPIANLYHTRYGQMLLIKVGVFLLMIAIGAINLRYLKPRLSSGVDQNRATAARRLWINVSLEIALTIGILVIIGILGLLPPGVGMD
jgi:copper resistance protein D